MSNAECKQCGSLFANSYLLSRHQSKKVPCSETSTAVKCGATAAKIECKYCGQTFTRQSSLARHRSSRCKATNVAVENVCLKAQLDHNTKKVKELEQKLQQLSAPTADRPPSVTHVDNSVTTTTNVTTNHTNNSTNTSTSNNTNNITINIIPWDSAQRIFVSEAQLFAAFAENEQLRSYAAQTEHEMTDSEKAPPYVAAYLMELVKRGHADPKSRNVHLNPNRADQALTYTSEGRWIALPLDEVTRLLLDGVHKASRAVEGAGFTPKAGESEQASAMRASIISAMACANLTYYGEPDEYVRRVKSPMSAHLTNCAPSK